MIEINSPDEFKKYRYTEGYFIITDSANGNKVHINNCKTLEVSNFKVKVTQNQKGTGQYFFTTDLLEALEYSKVKKCDVCRRNF
jgi:hypothetical protein